MKALASQILGANPSVTLLQSSVLVVFVGVFLVVLVGAYRREKRDHFNHIAASILDDHKR